MGKDAVYAAPVPCYNERGCLGKGVPMPKIPTTTTVTTINNTSEIVEKDTSIGHE